MEKRFDQAARGRGVLLIEDRPCLWGCLFKLRVRWRLLGWGCPGPQWV